MFSPETYKNRRAELKKRVGRGVILLLGNDYAGYNYRDNEYEFRQDSTFLYYFGLNHDGLNAIIDIDNDREILFGDELTIDMIVWTGNLPTLHEQALQAGITDVRPASDLKPYLDRARAAAATVHYIPYYRAAHDLRLMEYLDIRPGGAMPSVPLIKAVVDMRNHKSAEEIAEIERACAVTALMHKTAIASARPGMKEYELKAIVENVAASHNMRLSFPTIATVHGEILHNHGYGNTLEPGQLFLLDAGAETPMGYAGDNSSTSPVGMRYTPRQKAIYDLQQAASKAAIDMLRPGVAFYDVHLQASRVIASGLKDLGIMKGDVEEAVRAGAHAMFFPTGLGHMMGLDVHDMENYGEVWVGYDGKPKSTLFGFKSLRLARPLEEGFVFTIEPGIYFMPELTELWKSQGLHKDFINYAEAEKWLGFGGVRNEQDYLVTADGHRLLGPGIPMTTEDVEALKAEGLKQ